MPLSMFELSTQACNGRHFEAYINQETLYRRVLEMLHQIRDKLNILDFGCGPHGVGRMLLRSLKKKDDKLYLFDPHATIEPSRDPNEFIATKQDVYGDARIPFDIVNLSYVLCCMEPIDAIYALKNLKASHSKAMLAIVDYTLRNRSEIEVLQLLTSHEEMKWRRHMGDEAFAHTRRQFTPESLEHLIRMAGYSLLECAIPLDKAGIRAAIVALPCSGQAA